MSNGLTSKETRDSTGMNPDLHSAKTDILLKVIKYRFKYEFFKSFAKNWESTDWSIIFY